jgi:hypothetical protein
MQDKIILAAAETVVCPKCEHAFALHEGIARQTIERHHAEFEQETRQFKEQIAADLSREAERRAAQQFGGKLIELQDQVATARRSEREAKEAIDKARNEARAAAAADSLQQMKALQEDMQRQGEELQRLRGQELDLRRERQALQEQQRNGELELQRKLDEERIRINQQVTEREGERFRLQEAEYRKRLDDVQKANEDLRRKLEQGSQQLQGEVLELQVEQSLTTAFFHDLIEEVKKGVRGADVIQTVRTVSGQVAGKIIWEAKRAENWSDRWLDKLKDDQREAKADLAVLVSTCMPRGVQGPFARVGEVWVVSPQVLRPMAETLRVILIESFKLKQANTGKGERVEQLFNYLSGPTFAQNMRSVLDSFTTMQGDLDAEKRAMTKLWGKRQAQIDRVVRSMTTVIGELQGIAQGSLPALDGIESLEVLANSGDDFLAIEESGQSLGK